MGRFFVPNSRNAYIRGILTIVLGGLFLFVPGLTMKTVMIMIGGILLVSGLITMILSNWKRPGSSRGYWSAQGIMNVLFGLVFIFSPTVMIEVFVVFIGIILLIMGFLQFFGALSFISRSIWAWIFLGIALVTLASGVFLLSDPSKSAETILPFLGVLLILNGISGLFMAWKSGRMPQSYKGAPVQDVTYEEIP